MMDTIDRSQAIETLAIRAALASTAREGAEAADQTIRAARAHARQVEVRHLAEAFGIADEVEDREAQILQSVPVPGQEV